MTVLTEAKKTPEEKWEILMWSIRDVAHKLNLDLTERDMPDYLNWSVARDMHQRLWARLYARNRERKLKRLRN